jgi:hypothetical protein
VDLLHLEHFLQHSLGAFQFELDSTIENLPENIKFKPVEEDLLPIYVSYYSKGQGAKDKGKI